MRLPCVIARVFSLAPPAIAKHPRSGAEWEGKCPEAIPASQGRLPQIARMSLNRHY
jgi:hypothetical protein